MLLMIYVSNWWHGSSQNDAISKAWARQYTRLFQEQFSRVGVRIAWGPHGLTQGRREGSSAVGDIGSPCQQALRGMYL